MTVVVVAADAAGGLEVEVGWKATAELRSPASASWEESDLRWKQEDGKRLSDSNGAGDKFLSAYLAINLEHLTVRDLYWLNQPIAASARHATALAAVGR